MRVKRVLAAASRVAARSMRQLPIGVRFGRAGLVVTATDQFMVARWTVPWVGQAAPQRDGVQRSLCPEAARWLVRALRGVGTVPVASLKPGVQVAGIVFPGVDDVLPDGIDRFFTIPPADQPVAWVGTGMLAAVGGVFKSCESGYPVQVEALYPSGAPAAGEHPSRGLAVRYTSEHCSVVVMGIRAL